MKTHLMFSAYRENWTLNFRQIVEKIKPSSIHVHVDDLRPIHGLMDIPFKLTLTDNLGKKKYTQICSLLFEGCRNVDADMFFFFQDDIELVNCDFNFGIQNFYAILLLKEIINKREGWGDSRVIEINDKINKIGWVDCSAFICSKEALELINYKVPDYPESRWENKPELSSGVGYFLSNHWKDKLYQVSETYVKHDVNLSSMNPNRKNLRDFPTTEVVNGVMATMKERQSTLKKVIESLEGQLHRLYLYSDYVIDDLPDWVTLSVGENIGDRGRWKTKEKLSGYVFTLDDDLIYPPSYSITMINFLNSFNKKAIVSVHGRYFKEISEYNDYYADTESVHFSKKLDQFQRVDFAGSGTALYHTDVINPRFEDFKYPNISDVWLGLFAKKENIPIYVINREQNWLKEHSNELSIYSKKKEYKSYYDEVIKDHWEILCK